MKQVYDDIGIGYRRFRQPDPRIASAIVRALGTAACVLNVGAGAGSYEPADRVVVAVEPSLEMIRQRPARSAPVVRACATALPFRSGAFDAGLAILTLHHWPDWRQGLAELRRVAGQRVVLVTWDPEGPGFWLTDDYFPAITALDLRTFPSMADLQAVLGDIQARVLPVPADCLDGFLGAYWRRPAAYLDAERRRAISAFSMIESVEPGLSRLEADLADGTWERRHGHLHERAELDIGYRIVIAS